MLSPAQAIMIFPLMLLLWVFMLVGPALLMLATTIYKHPADYAFKNSVAVALVGVSLSCIGFAGNMYMFFSTSVR